MNIGRIIDAARGLGELVKLAVTAWRSRKDPAIDVTELHVGATTTDAIDRAREDARAKWPEADVDRAFPRPPPLPRFPDDIN